MSESPTVVRKSQCRGSALWSLVGRICIALVIVMGTTEQASRAQDCALDVKVDERNPVAYQARRDRCEGVYDQPAANRINLHIAGFHLGAPVFDPRKDNTVRIVARPYEARWEVQLRVISTRRRDYFQMDTSTIGDDGSFTWSLDVVRQLDDPLRPFATAALACVSDCRSTRAPLLPVNLSGASAADSHPPTTLMVLVMADVELSNLTATLRQGAETIFEDLVLGHPPLPPHKPIRIPIDGVDAGEALLSISAATRRGQRDYVEAVLLVPELER